ncbi:MAG TPA: elongation factor P maturation arginine rhamnosyltransferase EarP [Gemmatales bacterium]|nr:elongation factor P maturation arginine rhamnosyltransferase EarP [Gemmatales bacterium]
MQLRSTISRVRLRLESLEERLTPSWSSTPPATLTSLPASFTSITQNSAGDATGNASIATTEIDWYRFTATASGAATFQALTPASNLDTVIAVYNSSRARVGYNDDISNTNRDSRFTVNLTAGQTYYFGVTNYTGTAGGSYTWSLDGAAASGGGTDDSYENNDTRATASVLGSLTASRTINNLVMADGNDWYQFTLPTAGASDASVSISFLHSQGDLDLELYNAAGTRIGNSDSATNSEFISLSGLAAGTYTVRVLGYNGANNPNYSMVLTPGTGGTSTGNFDIQLRMTGLTASQQAIFQQAVARWQQIIIGDLPAATYNGVAVDDLLIDASASPIDGAGGILGQAGPDRFRSGSSLPYHGTMQFDSADLASLESSGGLIREAGLLAERDAFQANPAAIQAWWQALGGDDRWSERFAISLFGYEVPALSGLLASLAAGDRPARLLVTESRILSEVLAWFGREQGRPGEILERGALRCHLLPFLTQTEYDRLLWACDFNVVRGEDSFLRAQWAGRPFVWQIYRQAEGSHWVKLKAFLDRYLERAEPTLAVAVRDLHTAWNQDSDLAAPWQSAASCLPAWQAHARQWAAVLAGQADLALRLVQFAKQKL